MRPAITALAVAFAIVTAVFLIMVGGRFLPVADAVLETLKVPAAMVPPIVPHLCVLTGCGLLMAVAFQITLNHG